MTLPRAIKLFKTRKLMSQPGTVLDYGCGDGSSQSHFEAMGFTYAGWDIDRDQSAPSSAELVNLSYVLNIIPDQAERRNVLIRAWQLSESALLVTIPPGFLLSQTREHVRMSPAELSDRREEFEGWTQRNLAWLEDATGAHVQALSSDVFLCSCGQSYVQSNVPVLDHFAMAGQTFDLRRRQFMQWLTVAFGGVVVLGATGVAQASTITDRVRSIVMSLLGATVSEVSYESKFIEDLGADSLDTVELIMEIELEFGVTIPDEEADAIETVGQMISYIEAH